MVQQGGPMGADSSPATGIAADINWSEAIPHGATG